MDNFELAPCIGGTVGDPLEGVEETSKHEAGGLYMVIIIIVSMTMTMVPMMMVTMLVLGMMMLTMMREANIRSATKNKSTKLSNAWSQEFGFRITIGK